MHKTNLLNTITYGRACLPLEIRCRFGFHITSKNRCAHYASSPQHLQVICQIRQRATVMKVALCFQNITGALHAFKLHLWARHLYSPVYRMERLERICRSSRISMLTVYFFKVEHGTLNSGVSKQTMTLCVCVTECMRALLTRSVPSISSAVKYDKFCNVL